MSKGENIVTLNEGEAMPFNFNRNPKGYLTQRSPSCKFLISLQHLCASMADSKKPCSDKAYQILHGLEF